MATAAVDVLGILPGPATKLNAGACDLLAGEAFAYAVSSAVAVVDVSAQAIAEPALLPNVCSTRKHASALSHALVSRS